MAAGSSLTRIEVNADIRRTWNEDEQQCWTRSTSLGQYLSLRLPNGSTLRRLELDCSGLPHEHLFPGCELNPRCLEHCNGNLERLELQSCRLRQLGLPVLPKLQILNISYNRITTLQGIGKIDSLWKLDVSHNDLSACDDVARAAQNEALLQLRSLRMVNLGSNPHLDVGMLCHGLCSLEEINEVDIGGTLDELRGGARLHATFRQRSIELEIMSWHSKQEIERGPGLGQPPHGTGRRAGVGGGGGCVVVAAHAEDAQEPEPELDEPELEVAVLNQPGYWDVMISYTQRNAISEALATAISSGMKERRKQVWRDVEMDKKSKAAMKEGVKNSLCVVAIVSGPPGSDTAYFKRPFCLDELRWAREAGVTVVPVVALEDKEMITEFFADIPEDLKHIQDLDWKHIDRKDEEYFALGMSKIIKAVPAFNEGRSARSVRIEARRKKDIQHAAAINNVAVLTAELERVRAENEALKAKHKTDFEIARTEVEEEQKLRCRAEAEAQKTWEAASLALKQMAKDAQKDKDQASEQSKRAKAKAERAAAEAAAAQERAQAAEQQAANAACDAQRAKTAQAQSEAHAEQQIASAQHAAEEAKRQAASQAAEAEEAQRQVAAVARAEAKEAQQQVAAAQRAEAAAREAAETAEAKAKELLAIPEYWKNQDPDAALELCTTQHMVRIIQQAMNASVNVTRARDGVSCGGCGATKGNVNVTAVTRVENMTLWRHYQCFRQSLRDRAAPLEQLASVREVQRFLAPKGMAGGGGSRTIDPELNEFWLWHGTTHAVADILATTGFDERVANLGGLYGAGSYFADAMCKSHQYARGHANPQGEFCILYCRVTMGSAFRTARGHGNERRPPPNPADPRRGASFDSIFAENGVGRGGSQLHNEFVVFRDYQVYPEFIVRYTV